jgi:hypothetical protein
MLGAHEIESVVATPGASEVIAMAHVPEPIMPALTGC